MQISLAAKFKEECCMYSCSDMNKIKMGPATAVSHYHQQYHFFLWEDSLNFAENDLPNPGYLIICSGYQIIIIKKLYGPFLWIGFNCLKARATSSRQFTFYHWFLGNNSLEVCLNLGIRFYIEPRPLQEVIEDKYSTYAMKKVLMRKGRFLYW